jgi:hypothetical protein
MEFRHGASRYLITRIVEIAKCQNAKLRHGVSEIATWRVEMPRNRNSRHAKSRNAKNRNAEMRFSNKAVVTASGHICGRWRKELVQPSSISVIVTWSVETLHHRNVEMRNCESALWISAWSPPVVTSSKSCREELEETSSISEFGTWRVETTLHRIPETRNAKCVFRIGPWS